MRVHGLYLGLAGARCGVVWCGAVRCGALRSFLSCGLEECGGCFGLCCHAAVDIYSTGPEPGCVFFRLVLPVVNNHLPFSHDH
jgi:hypothetical protein